jgi:tetratricopeptide (TPR) repeat protein
LLLCVVLVSPSLMPAADYTDFNKTIAYILLKDQTLALSHLEAFFENFNEPALRSIFVDLIKNNSFEVTKAFKRFLDINHRSLPALLGIALSTTDMKVSTSIFNLERAQRLEPSFSAVYLCLGMEYMKQKNYPRAEYYFNQSLRFANIPEYKVLLSELYFLRDEPGRVVNLLKTEANRYPDNFYFSFYTAKAYYELGQVDEMRKYIETALEVNPVQNDANLLMARYLLAKNELKQALVILRRIRFNEYNEDYYTTFAHVLLKLNDRKTTTYLDEVYSKNRWNKDINRLMGLYYARNKRDKESVQNWVNRSILSGNPIAQLKELFPEGYTFTEYNYLPFFEVYNIQWISNDLLVVGAKEKSGDDGKLFFIQPENLKVMNVFSYKGELQDIFLSEDRTKFVFTTAANSDEKNPRIYLYAVEIQERSLKYKQLHAEPLPIASAAVGFNKAGSLVYITDNLISRLAFESPFAVVPQIGARTYVYESYPFPIYMYNFGSGQFGVITDMSWLGKVPIPCIKKYYAVSEASGLKSNIQKLIQKGQQLDLTSSEIVKIFFANDLTSFIIYLSDLTNAFQAIIYESFNNRVLQVDETMFLGKGEYAEVELLNFDPWNKEILLITKDEKRNLIHFDYKTYIFIHPADKVCEYHYDSDMTQIYTLTERSKKRPFNETNLEIISFNPYYRKIVDKRRDLEKILFNKGDAEVYFSTFTGEWLVMDSEYKFHYLGPCFEGCRHAMSPSRKKTAAFINGRLYIVNGPVKKGSGFMDFERAKRDNQ